MLIVEAKGDILIVQLNIRSPPGHAFKGAEPPPTHILGHGC